MTRLHAPIAICIALALGLAGACLEPVPAASAPSGYVKVWEDEFDGPSLDESTWTIGLRHEASGDLVPGAHGARLLNTGYAGYITDEDVIVSDGTLILRNQKRDWTGTDPAGDYEYTSGWVMSMHELHFNGGYVEIRAQFPSGDKVWPALWLIAEDLIWGPEWDLFEYFGYRSDVGFDQIGMHLAHGSWPDIQWASHWLGDFDATWDCEAWHVYGFEWTSTHAKWFIDGVEVIHLDNTIGDRWPDEEMYIVLNNGVRTSSPDLTTTWPNDLVIDSVALYQPVGLLRNDEVSSLTPLTPSLADVLPLDLASDAYVRPIAPGDLDPDASVLGDGSRPLVFYALDFDGSLRLSKTREDRLRIDF